MRFGFVLAAPLLALAVSAPALAQEPATATRDDGRKVLLYPDGTWRLVADASAAPATSTSSPAPAVPGGVPVRSKPADSTLYVKAPAGPFGIWMNPDKWKQDDAAEGDANKITFSAKKGDGYAMIIAERIAVPMDSLRDIALTNAKQAAPDARILLEEKRIVNGKEILCLELQGTTQNIAFTYYGYYYGGPEGTLQVVTYTGANLFAEFKSDFEEFLDGTQIGK